MHRMKKGLFFGVSMALLIAIMLVSLSLWTKTTKMREASDSEKFEIMSLKAIEASVSEEKLAWLAKVEGRKALESLDSQVRNSGEYSKDVAKDLEEIMRAGSFGKLNETISEIAGERGFWFSLSWHDFEVSQKDAWTVLLRLKADIEIRSTSGRVGISRSRTIEVEIPIEGLEDPLVGVESWKTEGITKPGLLREIVRGEREYYVKNITEAGSFVKGKGWAYGKITGAGETGKGKILLIKENTDRLAKFADIYAGVVSEASPVVTATLKHSINSSSGCMAICDYYVYEETSNCLDCMRWTTTECEPSSQSIGAGSCKSHPPYILELTGKNDMDVPFVSGIKLGEANSVLINSPENDSLSSFSREMNTTLSSVWDIEGLRRLALCGAYVRNPDAPDFLQRLRGEKNSKSENGIESLLLPEELGKTAGKKPVSMVDYLYYSGTGGIAVKGMPGCENEEECRRSWPLGSFALDRMHLKFYGADAITCGNETAPC